jgi:hypothetical protein
MADIDVVPKHRSNTWVWILLAVVVVALLIWAFAGRAQAATELRQGYSGALHLMPGSVVTVA